MAVARRVSALWVAQDPPHKRRVDLGLEISASMEGGIIIDITATIDMAEILAAKGVAVAVAVAAVGEDTITPIARIRHRGLEMELHNRRAKLSLDLDFLKFPKRDLAFFVRRKEISHQNLRTFF